MPAYAPDCQHDFFVSYGRVDDQGDRGWVSCFVEDLKQRLSERLGRKDNFSLWKDDHDILQHQDFANQITLALETSACMLVILSPGYLQSYWCQRERTEFLKWVRERDESGSRIIVIERDWVEEDRPDELKKLIAFKFWKGEPKNQSNLPRPLDRERDSDYEEYNDLINGVAHTLVSQLSLLKRAASRKIVPAGVVIPTPPEIAAGGEVSIPRTFVGDGPAPIVFLAEVTDDLRPQWKKIRTELDHQGVRIVSGGAARDAAATELAVTQALQESQLFVQLLGQFPGQPVENGAETYAVTQHRLALKAQLPILQWRSPQLTEEVFDAQEVEDSLLAARHRQLVFGRVRAEHIEDFKRHLIAVVTAPPPKPIEIPPSELGTVYVSFNPDPEDTKFARELCGYLEQLGYGIAIPLTDDDADPDDIQSDFESNVLRSHGWIVVYGASRRKFWVRGQLNQIHQLLCQHDKHAKPIHLCAGPPPPKEVQSALTLIGIQLPQKKVKVIDCQSGFVEGQLHEFLDAITGREVQPLRGQSPVQSS